MRINRLIELLQGFTPDEHRRLRLFVASPYYVQGKMAESLPALLDLALVCVESQPETWPDTKAAYTVLFPDEPFVQGKLEKRVGTLYQLALQFLVAAHLFAPDNNLSHQMALIESFQQRGMFDLSAKALKAANILLKEPQNKNEHYYWQRYYVTILEANQTFLNPSKGERFSFNNCFEPLYQLYQKTKLDILAAISAVGNRCALKPSALAQKMIDEEPYVDVFTPDNPLLYFTARCLNLQHLTKPDYNRLDETIRVLRERQHTLQLDDKKRVWAMVRNIHITWWNLNKDLDGCRQLFGIFLDNLADGYLYYSHKILPHTLGTMCKVCADVGMPEVARDILLAHRGRISGETEAEPYFHYNLARYHLFIGEPDEALRLMPASMPESSFQLQANLLELQVLYELDSELLPYRMDAFRLALRRTVNQYTSDAYRTNLMLFHNTLARICRCPPGNARRAKAIQAQLLATPQTMEYFWLLRKIVEKGQISS